jgi:hypothetical protein
MDDRQIDAKPRVKGKTLQIHQAFPSQPLSRNRRSSSRMADQEPLNTDPAIERIRIIFENVPVKGSFSAGGIVSSEIKPKLRLVDSDRILDTFPLPITGVQDLIQKATLAPYGTHNDTVTDPTVRKTWQLDGVHFQLHNQLDFEAQTLRPLLRNILKILGISSSRAANTHAQLYKLLIYETGSHFQWYSQV